VRLIDVKEEGEHQKEVPMGALQVHGPWNAGADWLSGAYMLVGQPCIPTTDQAKARQGATKVVQPAQQEGMRLAEVA